MVITDKYGTQHAQQELLKLMKVFHQLCVQKKIQYSLAYGTLLGAIRHQGFIPWDDDLDIFIDRQNYRKLQPAISECQELKMERDKEKAFWLERIRSSHDSHTEKGNYKPTIDVFILDKVPQNKLTRILKVFLLSMLQGMMKPQLTLDKGSIALKCCLIATFLIGRCFPMNWKNNAYQRLAEWGGTGESSLIANYNGDYGDIRRYYRGNIMGHLLDTPFEDASFSIVTDYDYCLKLQYGDYMTPPQENDRIPSHGA